MANIYGFSQNGNNNIFGYSVPNPAEAVTISGKQVITGTKTLASASNTLNGNGAAVTNVPAPSNMVSTDTTQTITAAKLFNNPSNVFYGSGANLTNLPAGNFQASAVYFSKTLTLPASTITFDIIANGTATTTFNTLSNGVWKIQGFVTNAFTAGATFIQFSYGSPTNATVLNGTVGTAANNLISNNGNLGGIYTVYSPELFVRTTGNGTTAFVINLRVDYSTAPTLTANFWAVKISD